MVLIEVDNAPASILGTLQRRLLEVRSGLFVGNLSKRAFVELWEMVTESTTSSGLLVYPAKNELGLAVRVHGGHRYMPVDHFGIFLIEIRPKKAGDSR